MGATLQLAENQIGRGEKCQGATSVVPTEGMKDKGVLTPGGFCTHPAEFCETTAIHLLP
jgi:hypothetical protein